MTYSAVVMSSYGRWSLGRLVRVRSLGAVLNYTDLQFRGPNWIHGTENNPIHDLVQKTETPTYSFSDRHATFAPDGSRLPDKIVRFCAEIMWNIIADAMKYSNEHSGTDFIPESESLMDYLEKEVPLRISPETVRGEGTQVESVDDEVNKRRATVLQMAQLWGAYIGSATDTQSLRFLWLEECLDGENLFCAGTYRKVLTAIAAPAESGADIKFGCTVKQILSCRNGENGELWNCVREGSGTEADHVVVVYENVSGNGEVQSMEFEEVVVTTPLGWLKSHKQNFFFPELPEEFKGAIDELGYGSLDKVSL